MSQILKIASRAKHIMLAEAMQHHYRLSYWLENNFLADEPHVFTCLQQDTEDLLDSLSLAGYMLCSLHDIQELLDAKRLIVRIASVHPEHIAGVEHIQLGASATALLIIPHIQPQEASNERT